MTRRRAAAPALAAVLVVVAALVVAALAGWDESSPRAPTTRVVSISAGSVGASKHVGTGFTGGPGRVVTVAHLVDDARTVAVHAGRRGSPLRARVLRRDRRADLALLAVPGLRAPPLRTARSPSDGQQARLLLRRRDLTVARAAPVRRQIVAHVRSASGARPERRAGLELAAGVAPGDSGAPVVAPGGEVVGVVFARSRHRPKTAYAVGAAAVARLLGGGRRHRVSTYWR